MTRQESLPQARATPLTRIVEARPPAYASISIEQDRNIKTLEDYIPGSGTLETVARLGAGMRGGKRGHAISVTGPYGSGKSTMCVFLDGLVAPSTSKEWKAAKAILRRSDPRLADTFDRSRRALGVKRSGMIRCLVTSRREPIAATILRALDAGARQRFGKYRAGSFSGAAALNRMVRGLARGVPPDVASITDVVRGLCAVGPVLMVIDEFGKNVEYFTDENTHEGDLFLLQELAEMSGGTRDVPLFMITLQHMAFEEYATGASSALKQEWAKVQGRFDDIPFANSPEQTRLLITSMLQMAGGRSAGTAKRAIDKWARSQAREAASVGLGSDLNAGLLLACYPLHPLALEVIPELCSRYGQHERTLISFITGGGEHTVSRFIDRASWDGRGALPLVRLDALYDYFVSGSPLVHSISSKTSRLLEIETIIRDTQGLSDKETAVLKSIGILNLVGRAGRLRASRTMIEYAIGANPDKALKALERRSIVTYRRHSDEYRIWHGTDVDIQAKLEIARRKLAAASLTDILESTLQLDPVVAARHALQTGTVRIFERVFADQPDSAPVEPQSEFDGVIVYLTGPTPPSERRKMPANYIRLSHLEDLREAALEVASIRDVRNNSPEIQADWVSQSELAERLAWAESSLERAFETASVAASGRGGARRGRPEVTLSHTVSALCDEQYSQAPRIFNEMITRNALTAQGSTALNKLLGAMIERSDRPVLGMDGWGPERAMYEAVLGRTGIHRASGFEFGLHAPSDAHLKHSWRKIVSMAKDAGKRVPVASLYETLSKPPYGVKAGLLPVILVSVLLVRRDRMALYEHGTYCRALTLEIAERLVRNPAHFEVKHFEHGAANRATLECIAGELGLEGEEKAARTSVLSIVSHLVRVYAALSPHIKKTKMLSKKTLAVRLAIETAVEPDTLLLDSLPRALGHTPLARNRYRGAEAEKFATDLAKSVAELGSAFDRMLDDLVQTLLKSTLIQTREKLSKAAATVAPAVLDHEMKIFLTAVTNDVLEHDMDWIKYVALALTGVPPSNWSDEQRILFTNNLKYISARFARLSSMRFADVSDSYAQPAYRLTVTHADGREDNSIVSLPPSKRRHVKEMADRAINDLRGKGYTDDHLRAFLAELSTRISSDGVLDAAERAAEPP